MPSEKKSWPSASSLTSSRTCSPGTSVSASSRGGVQSPRPPDGAAAADAVLLPLDRAAVVPVRPDPRRDAEVGLLGAGLDLVEDPAGAAPRGGRCAPGCRRSRPRGRRSCPATPCPGATRSRRRRCRRGACARPGRGGRRGTRQACPRRYPREWRHDAAHRPERGPGRASPTTPPCSRWSPAPSACGLPGDSVTMRIVCRMAVERRVAIGAQVSYDDREGFGRRDVDVPPRALREHVAEQVGLLCEIAVQEGAEVRYVKPHGALYNRVVHDLEQAEAVLLGSGALPVLGLPGSVLLEMAAELGREARREGFPTAPTPRRDGWCRARSRCGPRRRARDRPTRGGARGRGRLGGPWRRAPAVRHARRSASLSRSRGSELRPGDLRAGCPQAGRRTCGKTDRPCGAAPVRCGRHADAR